MPKFLVCYKWVLDEQDIKINSGTLTLDISRAAYKISDYDRNAIEEAVVQVEKNGGAITALTFGTGSAKQSLKDVLSRGPEEAFWVNDDSARDADAYVTANVLAAAAKQIGSYDVILCGEGASDTYAQQVGPRMAALLGIPAITFVSELKIEDGQVVATRKLGDCIEVVRAVFPVLVTVLPEINKPRIPSLKQVLGAAKKPVKEVTAAALGLDDAALTPKSRIKSVKGYVMSRKNVLYKAGDQAENVNALVASLAKEGVI